MGSEFDYYSSLFETKRFFMDIHWDSLYVLLGII